MLIVDVPNNQRKTTKFLNEKRTEMDILTKIRIQTDAIRCLCTKIVKRVKKSGNDMCWRQLNRRNVKEVNVKITDQDGKSAIGKLVFK